MRQVLSICLMAALVFAAVGCGSKDDTSAESKPDPNVKGRSIANAAAGSPGGGAKPSGPSGAAKPSAQ